MSQYFQVKNILLTMIKNNLNYSLRTAISNYVPEFSKLAEIQCHISHY